MYEYAAELVALVDGDTAHVLVDLGFDVHYSATLRFAGINAPETTTTAGRQAAGYVADHLPDRFTVRTVKDRKEKFGRMLAYLILPDGQVLNRMLVDSGNAVPYGNLPVDPP